VRVPSPVKFVAFEWQLGARRPQRRLPAPPRQFLRPQRTAL